MVFLHRQQNRKAKCFLRQRLVILALIFKTHQQKECKKKNKQNKKLEVEREYRAGRISNATRSDFSGQWQIYRTH